MTDRQLMQQALEAQIHKAGMNPVMQGECYLMHPEALQKLIEVAIREALAEQPAQKEPVAWISKHGVVYPLDAKDEVHPINELQPLYTSPPAQRKPLSDEEIVKITSDPCLYIRGGDYRIDIARAIEAAHGIKENT